MTMRRKPDVNAFLEGGAASDQPTQGKGKKVPASPEEARASKLVRLPKPMLLALKRRAVDESERRGERVTENDIVERALARYLGG